MVSCTLLVRWVPGGQWLAPPFCMPKIWSFQRYGVDQKGQSHQHHQKPSSMGTWLIGRHFCQWSWLRSQQYWPAWAFLARMNGHHTPTARSKPIPHAPTGVDTVTCGTAHPANICTLMMSKSSSLYSVLFFGNKSIMCGTDSPTNFSRTKLPNFFLIASIVSLATKLRPKTDICFFAIEQTKIKVWPRAGQRTNL